MNIMVRGDKPYYWTFHAHVTVKDAVDFLVKRSHAIGGLHCEPMDGSQFEGKQAAIQADAAKLYHEKGGE